MNSVPASRELIDQGRWSLLCDNTNIKDQWHSSVYQVPFLSFLGFHLNYIS